VLATANRAKAREMAALLAGIPFRVVNLSAFPGVTLPSEGESSTRRTPLARRAVASATGEVSLADDSGIEVDALGGGPGVLSARYGGPGLSDPERCEVMLREMASVPREKRTARFRCLIAIVCPSPHRETTLEGVVEGILLDAPRGAGGFGYDPLFFYPPLGPASPSSPRRRRTASAIAHRRVAAPGSGSWPRLERASGRAVYSRGRSGVWRSPVVPVPFAPVLTDPALAQPLA
jgi:XTP/dITP diphosphohydrolase